MLYWFEQQLTCVNASGEYENMSVPCAAEVSYAGGDADMKCSAYCWGPAWKVMELACDAEVMRSKRTCGQPGGKRSSPFLLSSLPLHAPLVQRKQANRQLSWSWLEPFELSIDAQGMELA